MQKTNKKDMKDRKEVVSSATVENTTVVVPATEKTEKKRKYLWDASEGIICITRIRPAVSSRVLEEVQKMFPVQKLNKRGYYLRMRVLDRDVPFEQIKKVKEIVERIEKETPKRSVFGATNYTEF